MTFRVVLLTDIGKLLVCGTQRGITSLGWTEEDPSERVPEQFKSWIEKIRSLDFDVPYELSGTEFQIAVWNEIRTIPMGKTISYAELARRIHKPNAVRAVATACGKNKIALIIPCHRVIRGDGSTGKYFWGSDRKKLLLDIEQDAVLDQRVTKVFK